MHGKKASSLWRLSGAVLIVSAAAAQAQSLTTLASFTGGTNKPNELFQGSNGNFYGVTKNLQDSIVFQMTPAGVLTTLLTEDVQSIASSLVLGSDGNFYGTSAYNGSNFLGTVFKLTPAKILTTLHQFQGTDGADPIGGLLLASDGNFYGTTNQGGANNANANLGVGPGTVFKISPTGVFSTIYNFSGPDGAAPAATLVQGSDGSLYGTTQDGGQGCTAATLGYTGCGTVFKVTPAGEFTTLHIFVSAVDGANPTSSLVQGSDGNFYGTTSAGGSTGFGTVYRITPTGVLTTLHTFTGADGGNPQAPVPMVLASDGNFYGTTFSQGNNGQTGQSIQGTIFKMTPSGTLTTIYNFCSQASCADGAGGTSLIQGSDGNFYGTTWAGGVGGNGTVFKFIPAVSTTPVISNANGVVSGASFLPGVAANSWITITGTNLSAVTDTWNNAISNGNLPTHLDGVSVMVGGQPAYIAYVSPTQINAVAPNVSPGTATVTVSTTVGTSAPVNATAQAAQPAFFQWGSYAVASKLDYSLAVKSGTFAGVTTAPAKPGDVIILWGTGFGPTTPSTLVGVEVPSTATYNTATPVTVTIGGVSATVYGAALAPGYAGLYQVAVTIPASLANGDYPVVASVAGQQSPATTLITVQQ